MNILTAQGISKSYRMGEVEVQALRGIDLQLVGGEIVVLLGASGSGKSTLLNIMGGLDAPTEGRIFYRDQDLTTANERALTAYRREHVGFVFQFYNLVPSLTASENVALVTDLAKDPMSPEEALALVGLTDDRRGHDMEVLDQRHSSRWSHHDESHREELSLARRVQGVRRHLGYGHLVAGRVRGRSVGGAAVVLVGSDGRKAPRRDAGGQSAKGNPATRTLP